MTAARGEIWWVNLDPVLGREQAGRRPALVISVDVLNQSAAEIVVVVPLTSRAKEVRSHVEVPAGEGGLGSRSFVKCEDIRSVSSQRLLSRLGTVGTGTMRAVEDRLRMILGL